MAEPVSTILGVKLSIAQGAVAGSAIAFILGSGTLAQRSLNAVGGALFAVYGTEGAVELLGRWITVTDATQRLGGLLFGICGIVIAQGLQRGALRLRDRSDALVDGAVDRLDGAVHGRGRRAAPAPAPAAVPPEATP